MRKEEYIAKYGQEAWDRKTEITKQWRAEHKEYVKEWRKSHPSKTPKKDEYIQKYGEAAWEKKLAQGRKWKSENKEKHLTDVREWQEKNKDKAYTYKNKWKSEHQKETRLYNLLSAYRTADESEGRGECTLSKDWMMEHIFASKCIYCGDSEWEHLGADRIDNSLPHTPENCVCACGICNVERGDRFTVEEFVEYRRAHPRECDKSKSNIL